MSPAAIVKTVKKRFPELQELPKAKLRLVEEALIYASELTSRDDLLSDQEHAELMEKIGGKKNNTSGDSLRAYRLRQNMTQSDLAKKSGIPQGNISAMESGKRKIGLNTAKKLARILNSDYRRFV